MNENKNMMNQIEITYWNNVKFSIRIFDKMANVFMVFGALIIRRGGD